MDNLSLDLETLVHRLQTDEIKVILKGKPKYITFVPPHPSSEPFSQFSDDRTPCGLYGDEGRGVCHSQLTEGAPLDVISFSQVLTFSLLTTCVSEMVWNNGRVIQKQPCLLCSTQISPIAPLLNSFSLAQLVEVFAVDVCGSHWGSLIEPVTDTLSVSDRHREHEDFCRYCLCTWGGCAGVK